LRKLTEQAVKLSGEIDLQRMQRQMESDKQRFDNRESQMQQDLDERDRDLEKSRQKEREL
jgi:hypothetical protein